jgi:hypothetical protein
VDNKKSVIRRVKSVKRADLKTIYKNSEYHHRDNDEDNLGKKKRFHLKPLESFLALN